MQEAANAERKMLAKLRERADAEQHNTNSPAKREASAAAVDPCARIVVSAL